MTLIFISSKKMPTRKREVIVSHSADRDCPLCGSDRTETKFLVGKQKIVTCRNCDFVYADEGEADLSQYGDNYFSAGKTEKGYVDYETEVESHLATFSARLADAEAKMGGPGLVLDIGCALGHFAMAAKARGWHVVATDVSVEAATKTRLRTGVPTFVSDLNTPAIKPGLCDVIAIYDVIEHVADPKPVLQRLRNRLQPQGWLHLTTPNVASFSARLLGSKWYHYKPGEHLLYFSPKTLRSCLTDAGWECTEIKSARSKMSIGAILLRLKRYSSSVFGLAHRMTVKIGLAEKIISVPIGEMQAWAQPAVSPIKGAQKPKLVRPKPISTDQVADLPILGLLCCPDCEGELDYRRDWGNIRCQSCPSRFDLQYGIPILMPQRAPRQLKLAGSA